MKGPLKRTACGGGLPVLASLSCTWAARRGLVQEGALEALLATSRRFVKVPADALALALAFSFALALSLLGSRSCRLPKKEQKPEAHSPGRTV